jgi:hypothetical protein
MERWVWQKLGEVVAEPQLFSSKQDIKGILLDGQRRIVTFINHSINHP